MAFLAAGIDLAALADHVRREMGSVKSWVQLPQSIEGNEALILVDEVRSSGQRRVRYRLVRTGSNWRIAAIEASQEVPAVVQALDRNLDRGLKEVVTALGQYFVANPPAKPVAVASGT